MTYNHLNVIMYDLLVRLLWVVVFSIWKFILQKGRFGWNCFLSCS